MLRDRAGLQQLWQHSTIALAATASGSRRLGIPLGEIRLLRGSSEAAVLSCEGRDIT